MSERHKLNSRLFLLTDGQVGNPQQIIDLAREKNSECRIHTFGIGSGCSTHLVEKTAEAGRGSSNIIAKIDDRLNGLVVSALRNASEPSLKSCVMGWKQECLKPLGEVYRGQLLTSYKIIKKSEFESSTFGFSFESSEDPLTKKPISWSFGAEDFMPVSGLTIFKTEVHKRLVNNTASKSDAIKYQVLSKDTAFVGVVKQVQKASGELVEHEIEFGKTSVKLQEIVKPKPVSSKVTK